MSVKRKSQLTNMQKARNIQRIELGLSGFSASAVKGQSRSFLIDIKLQFIKFVLNRDAILTICLLPCAHVQLLFRYDY